MFYLISMVLGDMLRCFMGFEVKVLSIWLNLMDCIILNVCEFLLLLEIKYLLDMVSLMVVIKSFVFWFFFFRKKIRIFCDYWEKNVDFI